MQQSYAQAYPMHNLFSGPWSAGAAQPPASLGAAMPGFEAFASMQEQVAAQLTWPQLVPGMPQHVGPHLGQPLQQPLQQQQPPQEQQLLQQEQQQEQQQQQPDLQQQQQQQQAGPASTMDATATNAAAPSKPCTHYTSTGGWARVPATLLLFLDPFLLRLGVAQAA